MFFLLFPSFVVDSNVQKVGMVWTLNAIPQLQIASRLVLPRSVELRNELLKLVAKRAYLLIEFVFLSRDFLNQSTILEIVFSKHPKGTLLFLSIPLHQRVLIR